MYKIIRPPLEESFELPSREDLLHLSPGDLVKLIFQVDNEMPERMWVKITSQNEEWSGIIDNDPVGEQTAKELKAGTEVNFYPLDVIQIWS